MNKKSIIIILVILLAVVIITSLYGTFASSNTVKEEDDVYTVTLTGSTRDIVVPGKTSKTVMYQICNTNKGTVQYGVGYSTSSSNIVVKEWWNTIDSAKGTITYGENKFVKIKISNNDTEDATVTLSTVLGYEYGGDLIPPSNVTLITDKINEDNYLMSDNSFKSETSKFLGSTLQRDQISSVTFVQDNIVPEGNTSVDISKNNDGTIIMWYGEVNSDNLYDVYIGSDNGITTLSDENNLFSYLKNAKLLDLNNVKTSSVTNMSYMFYGAGNSATVFELKGLENWDTSSVTDMSHMFSSAGQSATTFELKGLENWDTSSVKDMSYMFFISGQSATTFELEGIENWDTSSVTNMSRMFYSAGDSATVFELKGLENWDTSSVKDMSYMFHSAGDSATVFELKGLENWDTSSVANMSFMFNGAGKSATVFELKGLENWDTSSVTDMSYMFSSAGKSATTFELEGIENWDTSNVTNMSYMFSLAGYNAINWALDLSTQKVVTRKDGTTYTAWDVSNVEKYSSFNSGVESKVTPPLWVS